MSDLIALQFICSMISCLGPAFSCSLDNVLAFVCVRMTLGSMLLVVGDFVRVKMRPQERLLSNWEANTYLVLCDLCVMTLCTSSESPSYVEKYRALSRLPCQA